MVASSGRLACAPLLAGCDSCSFHLERFVAAPRPLCAESVVGIFLDLETTGLSLCDRIVEIGAVHLDSGAGFGVVVHPGREAIRNSDDAVHGIGAEGHNYVRHNYEVALSAVPANRPRALCVDMSEI